MFYDALTIPSTSTQHHLLIFHEYPIVFARVYTQVAAGVEALARQRIRPLVLNGSGGRNRTVITPGWSATAGGKRATGWMGDWMSDWMDGLVDEGVVADQADYY